MKQPKQTRPRHPESGYALLLVFAMAAIVAITLYTQVPRVAFEAQRDKEQMLMDRGQQYVRAIRVFVRKFNRFPATIEELENTNNQRFLRRRYVDPMTGKADWRILHAGPGGVITDSILSAKKTDGSQPQNFVTVIPTFSSGQDGNSDGVNLATRRRASDQPGAPGDPNNAAGGGGEVNYSPGDSSSGNSGNSGYNGPVMVLPDGRIVPASTTGTYPPAPIQTVNSPLPGNPGMGNPGLGIPGAPGATGPGGVLPSGVAIQQGAQMPPIFPPQPGGPPNGAATLLNQILTTPRPGGLNGIGGQAVSTPGTPTTTPAGSTPMGGTTPAGQTQIGGGLAGVASKREREGIKSYNDRTKYNEWEFVYDISKELKTAQQNAAGASGGQGRGGTPGQSPTGQFPGGSPTTGQTLGGQNLGGQTPGGQTTTPGTTLGQ